MRLIILGMILFTVLGVGLSSCSQSERPPTAATVEGPGPITQEEGEGGDPCFEPHIVPLWAGQHIDVGTVGLALSGDILLVEFYSTGGWVMTETHLATALSLDEVPMTGSGNPKVGQFLHSTEHDPAVTTYTYPIDLNYFGYQAGDTLYVAAHAAVTLEGEGGEPLQEETAWAEGPEFPGNSWATYFMYVIPECDDGGEFGGGGEE
ncbi:MAG: hypothetical protein GF355_04185 [Candidatus Eisenbacteria bacterium]|nr:hypothetical protein [Candidatus Eisenbacteria bacterium]